MRDVMELELARFRTANPAAGPVVLGRVVACDGGLVEVSEQELSGG